LVCPLVFPNPVTEDWPNSGIPVPQTQQQPCPKLPGKNPCPDAALHRVAQGELVHPPRGSTVPEIVTTSKSGFQFRPDSQG
jgi:hypothetical protein